MSLTRILVLLFFVGTASCAGQRELVLPATEEGAPDCAGEETQRLITFCASPQAADLAKRNVELGASRAQTAEVPFSPVPVGSSPTKGPETAPVTLVMFTDLQCPYCERAHEVVRQLMEERPADVRLVFKHAPLPFHQDAVPASLAALAAKEQGKFWEFVDRAYKQQDQLGKDGLLALAQELNLDVEQFRADFGTESHIASVEQDIGLGGQIGVRGTPTLFVNGIRIVGYQPLEELRALVDQQKDLVDRFVAAGVDQNDVYWRMVAVQYQQPPPMPEHAEEAPEQQLPPAAFVPVDGAPSKGAAPEATLVTIVQFSDFQCPFCAAANQAMNPLLQKNAADVRFVYRHYPLPDHPHAEGAAAASIAAAQAGKFWEFHDLLFANQDRLDDDGLAEIAKELELDAKAFQKARTADDTLQQIGADLRMGYELGVPGTPTFFVNGKMVMGMLPAEEMQALIDEQRALAAKIREETGLVGDELYRKVVEANSAADAQ